MTRALLISQDPYVISEIRQVAEVTGAQLEVTDDPSDKQLHNAAIVFVDSECGQHFSTAAPIWVVTSGPVGPQAWKCATQFAAQQIVSLPSDRAAITQALAVAQPRRSVLTAIVGLGSGIGASTVAAHVAAALSRVVDGVVLVDLHLDQGGLEILLGRENESEMTWSGAIDFLKENHHGLSRQLPQWNDLTYLASPISDDDKCGDPHRSVLDSVLADSQHVVIDMELGAGFDDYLVQCDNVCFIAPNTLRGIALAKKHLEKLNSLTGQVGLAVRDIPGSALAPLVVAQTLGLDLWSSIPSDARVVEIMEQGIGPVPIRSGSFNRSIGMIVNQLTPQETRIRAA